ncbi:MAG TPA: glycosyltransferase, partial [Arenicellales bacterium]|nr:glycosyltransferase [Arenicellales bacterium]
SGEGSGKLLHYMAAGLPVATFPTAHNQLLLGEEPSGRSSDPHYLADKIEKLLDDETERRRIGERNRRKAGEYSLNSAGQLILSIYGQIIRSGVIRQQDSNTNGEVQ